MPDRSAPQTVRTVAPGKPPRVLAVDDDPGTLLLLEETLTDVGFDVATAESGLAAIEACPGFEPDLVLLDINMPGMDGIAACAKIRQQSGQEFPIVMVTSVDDAASIQSAFEAGANDFILKPINWPIFQRRLDSVLLDWHRTRKLDETERRSHLLERVAPERAMLVSRSGKIIEDLKQQHDTRLFSAVAGYRSLQDLYGADIAARCKQKISGALKTGRDTLLEFSTEEAGVEHQVEARFMVDGRDRVIVVVQTMDIAKGKQSEIYDLAFFDSLTGLPNRHLFEQRAVDIFADAGLHGRSLSLVSLCFDPLADAALADEGAMRVIARRLDACVRGTGASVAIDDRNDGAPVAYVDSNHFLFIIDDQRSDDGLKALERALREAFATGVDCRSGHLTLKPHGGVAAFPADGHDLRILERAAFAAMHEACGTGRRFCWSASPALVHSAEVADSSSELRQAIDEGQLELYFQPRVAMQDRRVTGVEALLRWNHPFRGFVGLDEVLSLAKATGLIVPLGDWVLRAACEIARDWPEVDGLKVSVNLSQQEFAREDLASRVIDILRETGTPPERVELELTEAALLRTPNELEDLHSLKDLGVGLVLDNFGTGHSSLSYLKDYPTDALKIDGTFVRTLPENDRDLAVCDVIITMAHRFGMRAIAESVETDAQFELLRSLGCDECQGYLISKPVSGDEIKAYLERAGHEKSVD